MKGLLVFFGFILWLVVVGILWGYHEGAYGLLPKSWKKNRDQSPDVKSTNANSVPNEK